MSLKGYLWSLTRLESGAQQLQSVLN